MYTSQVTFGTPAYPERCPKQALFRMSLMSSAYLSLPAIMCSFIAAVHWGGDAQVHRELPHTA
jgi:hypothetical protein